MTFYVVTSTALVTRIDKLRTAVHGLLAVVEPEFLVQLDSHVADVGLDGHDGAVIGNGVGVAAVVAHGTVCPPFTRYG